MPWPTSGKRRSQRQRPSELCRSFNEENFGHGTCNSAYKGQGKCSFPSSAPFLFWHGLGAAKVNSTQHEQECPRRRPITLPCKRIKHPGSAFGISPPFPRFSLATARSLAFLCPQSSTPYKGADPRCRSIFKDITKQPHVSIRPHVSPVCSPEHCLQGFETRDVSRRHVPDTTCREQSPGRQSQIAPVLPPQPRTL